jgi:hypothetical protein
MRRGPSVIPIAQFVRMTQNREFTVAEARSFIKASYYFANSHPDVHIQLSTSRPADYHFQHIPDYEERARHSMFQSLDDAAHAVSAGLSCEAGIAAGRFLSVAGVNRVVLYSRSGAAAAPTLMSRAAIASMGTRTGTMYSHHDTLIVVMVLSIHGGDHVTLTTAYPTHSLAGRPVPPPGTDLLEYGNQRFTYTLQQS